MALALNDSTVTCIGQKLVYLENYQSILEYNASMIRIRCNQTTVKLCGQDLSITYLTHDDIEIKGMIKSIEYT